MEPRSAPGMVITLVGIALLVLFFVTDETDNFFLPIMLIFIGRTISKRAKRGQPTQKKAGQVVVGGNPTITVETLQDKFRAQQKGSSRQQSVRKSFEDRLREALMVPPMTAPAPPKPRVVVAEQPKEEPVAEAPQPVAPASPPKPDPRVAVSPRVESRRRVEAPAPHPAIGPATAAPTVRPSYSRTSTLTRRRSASPSTAPRIATKSSSEMVAEAKERLKTGRTQSTTAADRRA